MKRKTLTTVLRDLVSISLGSFGIIHQELTRNVSIELLVVYLILLGYPAAAGLFNIMRPGLYDTDEEESEEEKKRKSR